MDKKENTRKCTIFPNREREDFRIKFFRQSKIPSLEADVLLHINGKDLSQWDQPYPRSIAVIDCNWRKVQMVMENLPKPWPTLAKIPDGFRTAYPRRNKDGKDPEVGLATIEAVFIASAFCGKWDETLLKHYHFAKNFLELNSDLWRKYDLKA